MVSRLLRAWNAEFLKAIAGRIVWPVYENEEAALFAEFRRYYKAIGELAIPGVAPGDLTWKSRHQFFIATEGAVDEGSGTRTRGLSGLEQLLGYRIFKREAEPTGGDEGAGDPDLTTLSMALLTFPDHNIPEICTFVGSSDLGRITDYANRKIAESREQAKNKNRARRPPEAREDHTVLDDEFFASRKDAVLKQLAAMNLQVPPGF